MLTSTKVKADSVPDFNWRRDAGWIVAKVDNAKLETELLSTFRSYLLSKAGPYYTSRSATKEAQFEEGFGAQIDFLQDMSDLKRLYNALDSAVYDQKVLLEESTAGSKKDHNKYTKGRDMDKKIAALRQSVLQKMEAMYEKYIEATHKEMLYGKATGNKEEVWKLLVPAGWKPTTIEEQHDEKWLTDGERTGVVNPFPDHASLSGWDALVSKLWKSTSQSMGGEYGQFIAKSKGYAEFKVKHAKELRFITTVGKTKLLAHETNKVIESQAQVAGYGEYADGQLQANFIDQGQRGHGFGAYQHVYDGYGQLQGAYQTGAVQAYAYQANNSSVSSMEMALLLGVLALLVCGCALLCGIGSAGVGFVLGRHVAQKDKDEDKDVGNVI